MPNGMNVITISLRVKAEILSSIFPENGILGIPYPVCLVPK